MTVCTHSSTRASDVNASRRLVTGMVRRNFCALRRFLRKCKAVKTPLGKTNTLTSSTYFIVPIDFCYLVAVLVVEVVLCMIETSSRKIEFAGGLVRYNYTNKWVLI